MPYSLEEEAFPGHWDADDELSAACRAKNVAEIRRVFETTQLGPSDATRRLMDAEPDLPAMRYLLERGADPNAQPYYRVRYLGKSAVLKLLVEFGYDIKSEGHLLLGEFADSRETLDWLLDQGVDINRCDEGGEDPHHLATHRRESSLKVLNNVAARGDISLFDHLVSRGADPSRSMALHYASRCEDADRSASMISHLLDKHHMNIEADNRVFRYHSYASNDSGPPLISAIYNKNLAAVNELLKRGASPHPHPGPRGEDSKTELAMGVITSPRTDFLPALGPLWDAGAELDDALDYAVERDKVDAARLCLERGADAAAALAREEARVLDEDFPLKYDRSGGEGLRDEMRALLEHWSARQRRVLGTK